MSMGALDKLVVRDSEPITIEKKQGSDGPGGRLILGDGQSFVVKGLVLPVRNAALLADSSAGGFVGELRKFIFRNNELDGAGCVVNMGDTFVLEDGRKFSIVKLEDCKRAGLVAAYGKKAVR